MTALTAARDTKQMGSNPIAATLSLPVAAATTIYAGAMVAVNSSGYAVPASADSKLKVVGRCQKTMKNTTAEGYGAAGDLNVTIEQGIFQFVNGSSLNALTEADRGKLCYASDDNVVNRRDGMGTYPVAGKVVKVESGGVWVEIRQDLGPVLAEGDEVLLEAAASNSYASKRYYAVQLDTTAAGVKAQLPTVAGTGVFGFMQDIPAAGEVGRVRTRGRTLAVLGGTVTAGDKLTTHSDGTLVLAAGADRVCAIAMESGVAAETKVVEIVEGMPFADHAPHTKILPLDLASIANGDVLTNYTPGYKGRIKKVSVAVTKPATTAAKAATLNMEVGTTDLTGGVLALTSANMTPLGNVVAGTSITGGNTFSATDTISVEAASVTAFVEGQAALIIEFA